MFVHCWNNNNINDTDGCHGVMAKSWTYQTYSNTNHIDIDYRTRAVHLPRTYTHTHITVKCL